MESYKSDADNVSFNGTDAATSSTPADMPRGGRSTESRDDSIQSNHIQGVQAIIPENEGELGEDGVDGQDLTAATMDFVQALLEIYEHVRGGFRGEPPHLNFNLYKFEAANSTSPENKDSCCICLDEYCDGEEVAELGCGHLFHVGCIREWIKLKNTCPICKRMCAISSDSLHIRAFLVEWAATNPFGLGGVN